MMINNVNNFNPKFGAKLGWRANYELKQTPDKLAEITQNLKGTGEATTVVDIMSQETKKGRMYSLRLFNEIFGEGYSISLLKDKNNKDVVSSSAKDFLKAIENLTQSSIESKEYCLFNRINSEHSGSLPLIKYLQGVIKNAKSNGKYLSRQAEQTYFKRFL